MKLARGLSYSKWSDLGRLDPHRVMIPLPCPETPGQPENTGRGNASLPLQTTGLPVNWPGDTSSPPQAAPAWTGENPLAPDKPRRPKQGSEN